jgi:glycosyltransferase involved in cell wall biosynthesis
MRVLLLAPWIDATDVGEAFVAYKWAAALAQRVELTVLAFQRRGRPDVAGQLPGARVVTWPEPAWLGLAALGRFERLNAMLKPGYPIYARHVRRWLAHREAEFDIAHQLMPLAARYASPLRHFRLPYLIGPLGGTLETPPAFRAETGSAPLFTRLRRLDRLRFDFDPALRETYRQAAVVLGVAPYIGRALDGIGLRRFEVELELGIDDLPDLPSRRPAGPGGLRLLHVGRAVRTKGLRDVVRAMARLGDLDLRLTAAGDGEELAPCRAEATALGVAERIDFRGRVPRAEVERLYAESDVFVFPSFREPTGGVLYEAMRWGLPIVTVAHGGPDRIVDEGCGIKIPVTTPARMPEDIALAIRRLAGDPELRLRLGAAARAKLAREAVWPAKADRMVALYAETLVERVA